jgi:hypothetical protein
MGKIEFIGLGIMGKPTAKKSAQGEVLPDGYGIVRDAVQTVVEAGAQPGWSGCEDLGPCSAAPWKSSADSNLSQSHVGGKDRCPSK